MHYIQKNPLRLSCFVVSAWLSQLVAILGKGFIKAEDILCLDRGFEKAKIRQSKNHGRL